MELSTKYLIQNLQNYDILCVLSNSKSSLHNIDGLFLHP